MKYILKLLVWVNLVIGLKVIAIFRFGIGFEHKQKSAFGHSLEGHYSWGRLV